MGDQEKSFIGVLTTLICFLMLLLMGGHKVFIDQTYVFLNPFTIIVTIIMLFGIYWSFKK